MNSAQVKDPERHASRFDSSEPDRWARDSLCSLPWHVLLVRLGFPIHIHDHAQMLLR